MQTTTQDTTSPHHNPDTMSPYYNKDTMPPSLPVLPPRRLKHRASSGLNPSLIPEDLESCLTIWQSKCSVLYQKSARREPKRSLSDSQIIPRRLSDPGLNEFTLPTFSKPILEKENQKPKMFSTLSPSRKSAKSKKNAKVDQSKVKEKMVVLELSKDSSKRKEAWGTDSKEAIKIPQTEYDNLGIESKAKYKGKTKSSKQRNKTSHRKTGISGNNIHGKNSMDDSGEDWSDDEVILSRFSA